MELRFRALLYTDVEGSTRLTRRLGDAGAYALIRRHTELARELAAKHAGRVIELRGDGALLSFRAARDAVACAVALQRALAEQRIPERRPDAGLRVRIGLHWGPVLQGDEGYFGANLILAARLADQAPGSGILASRPLCSRARGSARFGRERRVRLKGFDEPLVVRRVFWRERPATRMRWAGSGLGAWRSWLPGPVR